MKALEASRAYKTHLVQTLALAKGRLSPTDYESMALGIRAEIERLSVEIEALRLAAFMGSTGTPIVPRILEFAANAMLQLQQFDQSAFRVQHPLPLSNMRHIVIQGSGSQVYNFGHSPALVTNLPLHILVPTTS